MHNEERIACRTPSEGKGGITRIPVWKFDCLSAAITDAVRAAGADGLPFTDLKAAVSDRLIVEQRDRIGSIGWHVTTVKLEMEVRGDLIRGKAKGPQRLFLPDML